MLCVQNKLMDVPDPDMQKTCRFIGRMQVQQQQAHHHYIHTFEKKIMVWSLFQGFQNHMQLPKHNTIKIY